MSKKTEEVLLAALRQFGKQIDKAHAALVAVAVKAFFPDKGSANVDGE